MNHPHDEEWVAYLDGETSPEVTQRLKQHLEECAQCADEIKGWRQSMDKLRKLSWPVPAHSTRRSFAPALRWAAAIVFVLSIGFALGRLSHRQQFQAVAVELKKQQATLAAELSQELIRAVRAGRAEDRQAILALVGEFQQQRADDYISLRKDLETVAATTDAGLRRANSQLTKIAATQSSFDY